MSAKEFDRFFLIGAARSGTSSLCYYLGQHSRLFVPAVKEPRYYAYSPDRPQFTGPGDDASVNERSIVDAGKYEELYGSAGDQLKGDGSTVYLYWKGTAERIHAAHPDARIIAILRDPAERAFSMYLHKRKQGAEELEFSAALDAEEERIREGWSPAWHYQQMGFYGQQLQAYLDVFPREQIQVLYFEDMKKDSGAVVNAICAFLGVTPEKLPDTGKVINQSHTASFLKRLFGKRPPKLGDRDRGRLNELYRPDVELLRSLDVAGPPPWKI
ncbi:MAG: sulfotransferase family protein [Limisphaerales bacterium]